ncbi:SGNH/GDSL hydrolase family protein [Terrihabitans sp. B22-R8]|uniref:SGNH/GDSL hydrolase family protein n=1 Tax=Terrihabitans sp. B22-R8 TaxID=3425128 RepID=UPI00403CF314
MATMTKHFLLLGLAMMAGLATPLPALADDAGRRVLLIGNSRTFYNDMPKMLAEMARSAGDNAALDVTVRATSGARFRTHLDNPEVHDLLAQRWSLVVLQAHSAAHSNDKNVADFLADGRTLIAEAKAGGSPFALVLNWAYAPDHYTERPANARTAHVERIASATHELARETGARVIDIGGAWEAARRTASSITLYADKNHPSIAGSYLFALTIYAALPGAKPAAVTYAPPGLTPADAARLREAVAGASAGG